MARSSEGCALSRHDFLCHTSLCAIVPGSLRPMDSVLDTSLWNLSKTKQDKRRPVSPCFTGEAPEARRVSASTLTQLGRG